MMPLGEEISKERPEGWIDSIYPSLEPFGTVSKGHTVRTIF